MGCLGDSTQQQETGLSTPLPGLAHWFGGLLVSHWGSPVWYQADSVANRRRRGHGLVFTKVWWDTPQGVVIYTPDNPPLAVGFVRQDRDVCVSQVQTTEQRSIWLRDGSTSVSPRSKVLLVLERASLACGIRLSTLDGDQKVQEILDLHGGFTLEEHADMQWAEWFDGQTVVPHIQSAYNRLPVGWSFAEPVDFLEGQIHARRLRGR
jgi:hypothetical protein